MLSCTTSLQNLQLNLSVEISHKTWTLDKTDRSQQMFQHHHQLGSQYRADQIQGMSNNSHNHTPSTKENGMECSKSCHEPLLHRTHLRNSSPASPSQTTERTTPIVQPNPSCYILFLTQRITMPKFATGVDMFSWKNWILHMTWGSDIFNFLFLSGTGSFSHDVIISNQRKTHVFLFLLLDMYYILI